jgi:hypothetical protein
MTSYWLLTLSVAIIQWLIPMADTYYLLAIGYYLAYPASGYCIIKWWRSAQYLFRNQLILNPADDSLADGWYDGVDLAVWLSINLAYSCRGWHGGGFGTGRVAMSLSWLLADDWYVATCFYVRYPVRETLYPTYYLYWPVFVPAIIQSIMIININVMPYLLYAMTSSAK